MSGKWTPGPWVVGKGAGYFIKRPNARMAHLVGMTPGFSGVGAESGNDEEARANAHLMSASPQLFDALKDLVEETADMLTWGCEPDVIRRARAALAKAKGEGA